MRCINGDSDKKLKECDGKGYGLWIEVPGSGGGDGSCDPQTVFSQIVNYYSRYDPQNDSIVKFRKSWSKWLNAKKFLSLNTNL